MFPWGGKRVFLLYNLLWQLIETFLNLSSQWGSFENTEPTANYTNNDSIQPWTPSHTLYNRDGNVEPSDKVEMNTFNFNLIKFELNEFNVGLSWGVECSG